MVPTSTVTTFTAVPIPGTTRSPLYLNDCGGTVSHRPARVQGLRAGGSHATSGTAHPRRASRGRLRTCWTSGPTVSGLGDHTPPDRSLARRRAGAGHASPSTPTSGCSSPSTRSRIVAAMKLSRGPLWPLAPGPGGAQLLPAGAAAVPAARLRARADGGGPGLGRGEGHHPDHRRHRRQPRHQPVLRPARASARSATCGTRTPPRLRKKLTAERPATAATGTSSRCSPSDGRCGDVRPLTEPAPTSADLAAEPDGATR